MTIKKESVKANFLFQILYQAILYLVPLFVSPYITRTLGEGPLGIYSFSNSIAYYFVVAANLGISRYGQREIARARKDQDGLRKTYWSLLYDHLMSSFISLFVFSILAFTAFSSNGNVYPLTILYVFSAMIDISWFFYGMENFKLVTMLNGIVTAIRGGLIFWLIKGPDDLWIYLLLTYLSTVLVNLILVVVAAKTVKPIRVGWQDLKKHLFPLLYFSISVIAVSLYTVFDKTLLGLMTTTDNVAYYEYANKIITIPKSIIGVLSTVLFPRITALIAQGKEEEANKYAQFSIMLITFLAMGSVFGLLGLGKQLCVYYYGENFATSGDCLLLMTPLIYITCIGDVLRTQYMIPRGKDFPYILCIVLNAVINIILSVCLIPFLGIYGAIIGTLGAEIFGLIYQSIYCRKFVSFKNLFLPLIPFGIIGVAMFGVMELFDHFMPDTLTYLLIEFVIGFVFYVVFSAIYFIFISPNKKSYRNYLSNVLKHKMPLAKKKVKVASDDKKQEATQENVAMKEVVSAPKEDNTGSDEKSIDDKKKQAGGGRDKAIDVLRIIGIFLIMLAHTALKNDSTSILMNVRRFDVVMMVFISGLSFAKSNKPFITWEDYFRYFWKRVKRLIFPCWIFISLYLLYSWILSYFYEVPYLTFRSVAYSYTMISGFGYVWIVRILFCMAIIAPFLKHIVDRIKSPWITIAIASVLYVLNCIVCHYSVQLTGAANTLVNTILLPILGYGIIYMIAIAYPKFTWVQKASLFVLYLVAFIVPVVIKGNWDIQPYKYPPTLIYLSYGLIVSIALYELFHWLLAKQKKEPKFILWLSANSFNLYFAHVFILFWFDYAGYLNDYWWLQYLILVFGSILLVLFYSLGKAGMKKLQQYAAAKKQKA